MHIPRPILEGLIQYVVLLFSLSVHESMHAYTASRFGDPTARKLGRVTLNPIAHMELFGTVIFPLIMIFTNVKFLIGWAKPVPVNLQNLRNPRKDNLWIAAAGPLSNLGLCLGFFLVLSILLRTSAMARHTLQNYLTGQPGAAGSIPSIWEPIVMFLLFGVFLNAILAIFNLLPIPPLDGGSVLQGLLPERAAEQMEGVSRYGLFILFFLMATGFLRFLFGPIQFFLYTLLFRVSL